MGRIRESKIAGARERKTAGRQRNRHGRRKRLRKMWCVNASGIREYEGR